MPLLRKLAEYSALIWIAQRLVGDCEPESAADQDSRASGACSWPRAAATGLCVLEAREAGVSWARSQAGGGTPTPQKTGLVCATQPAVSCGAHQERRGRSRGSEAQWVCVCV